MQWCKHIPKPLIVDTASKAVVKETTSSTAEELILKISFPTRNIKNLYTQPDRITFGQLVTKLILDKRCETQSTRTPGYNRTSQVAVQWLNQALFFYLSLCLAYNESPQNRHLHVAVNRYHKLNNLYLASFINNNMMKSFDIFSKAKYVVSIFNLLFICIANAQTPSVIQFDGQYPNMLPTKVAVCSDGGYILAQTSENNFNSTPYLIKIDSIGGVEWNRHFLAIPGVSLASKITRNVIQLPDSGFLYVGTILDPMFGTYESSTFHRLDRFGNVISAKGPIPGGFFTTGYGISPCFLKDPSKTVMGYSHYYEYNGTNGTCCDKYFVWELDTNLVPIMVNEIMEPSNPYFHIGTMQKIIHNGTFSGYVTGSKGGAHVMMFDINNNLLWSKNYGYGRINKIIQDDSTLVILGVNQNSNNLINAYIHRIDLNGNTLSINELIASDKIWPVDLIRKDSIYLVAALATPRIPLWAGYLNPHGLMISTDLTGSALQAYRSTDSLFTFAGFDTLRKIFLFARAYNPIVNSGFQVLRLSFDSTACGFLPYNISTISSTINSTNIIRSTSPDSLTLAQSQQLYFDTLITSSFACGLNSLTEASTVVHDFEVFPNPSNEFLNLKFDVLSSISNLLIICDVNGKEIYKDNIYNDEPQLRISLKEWNHGIYFVRLLNGKSVAAKKFIKN